MTSVLPSGPSVAHPEILWREAKAQAGRARRWARRAELNWADSAECERYCVETSLVLTAAALRDWTLWAHVCARVPLPARALDTGAGVMPLASLWLGLPRIARALGQPDMAVEDGHLQALDDLDNLCADVRHDPQPSVAALCHRLSGLGVYAPSGDLTSRAPLAAAAIIAGGHLFTWAHEHTTLSVPYTHQAWLAGI